jgi:hypothetical protein
MLNYYLQKGIIVFFKFLNPFRFFLFKLIFLFQIKEFKTIHLNSVFKVFVFKNKYVYKINRLDNVFSLKYLFSFYNNKNKINIDFLRINPIKENINFPIRFFLFGGYKSLFVKGLNLAENSFDSINITNYKNACLILLSRIDNILSENGIFWGDWNIQNLIFSDNKIINVDFEGFYTYNSKKNIESQYSFIKNLIDLDT